MRCTSPVCIKDSEGIRGREFTPPEAAEGLTKIWCPECLKMSQTLLFYSKRTAEMIKNIYTQYDETDLPKEVKLILTQFTREILGELNEEL